MAVQNSYNNALRDGLKVSLTGSSTGDIYYRDGAGLFTRLAVGTAGQVLKVSGTAPAWADQLSTEDIQDAVGSAFTDSQTIDFVYDDTANTMAASIVDGSVTNAKLRTSAATSLMGRSANSSGDVADIAFSADGQVLMRSNGTLAPVDLRNSVTAYRLDEFSAPTSAISLSGQRITNVAAPSASTDAANKIYVDNALQGVPYKSFVRTASAVDVDVTAPGASIGGIALTAGQNFLLYGQTDSKENGVYSYVGAASPATRRSDLELVPGMTIFVDEGTNADTTYQLTTNGPISVGTSNIDFTIFGRVESITVSSPLVRTGNNIEVSDNGITPAYFEQFPATTLLGNSTGSAADASYLTVANVLSMLGLSASVTEEYIVEPTTARTAAANKAYRPTSASLTTFTLPATCAEGATIAIEGAGAGGWLIAQAAGQSIIYGDKSTTVGVSGSLNSMHSRDVVKLRCVVADTTYQVVSTIGNLDVI